MDVTAFHPDLRRAARFLPRGFIGPTTSRVARRLGSLQARRAARGSEVVDLGSTSIWIHRPRSATLDEPRPALLWLHGGGYVLGSAVQDASWCRQVADELGILVGAVDYRLAPDHPFPLPLEDCYDALVWIAGRSEVDSGRIAVGGASAGGGLAAALAQLALERPGARLAFQLLVYPMLDDRTATRTDIDERNFRLWSNKSNRFAWQAYTGRPAGSPDIGSLAAPARAGDLSGLPPAWIGVGTLDLFFHEDLAYAERLKAAGVRCDVHVVKGAFHGFDVIARAGVSKEFRATQIKALAAAFGQ